jgi:hypothetical protein
MNLSATQVQNVLRTYQKQVREDRLRGILSAEEEPPHREDRVSISYEGRNRLQKESSGNRAPEDPVKRPR